MEFAGKVFFDRMFDREVIVYDEDKFGVWLSPSVDYNHNDPSGSVYPIDEFRENVGAGRFVRVDQYLNLVGIDNPSNHFESSPTEAEVETVTAETTVAEDNDDENSNDENEDSDPLSFEL